MDQESVTQDSKEKITDMEIDNSEANATQVEGDNTTYSEVRFLRKAMVIGSPALVHDIIEAPDSFVMPGFTLVALNDDTVCEIGMQYDRNTGEFSEYVPPEPDESQLENETTVENDKTES